MKTGEARDRLEAEHDIVVTTQTVTKWVSADSRLGRKIVGRWYVNWDALLAFVGEQAKADMTNEEEK